MTHSHDPCTYTYTNHSVPHHHLQPSPKSEILTTIQNPKCRQCVVTTIFDHHITSEQLHEAFIHPATKRPLFTTISE